MQVKELMKTPLFDHLPERLREPEACHGAAATRTTALLPLPGSS
jgi:hypothetical protein